MSKRSVIAIVVTYNRQKLLIRCIEHLRRQTVRLDNIIVVNNGSTDGTAEWLDNQTDLEVIHQENLGGAGGFYRGIQHAFESGYYWIWCMDDDVYPEPDCLEKLLEQDDDKVGILSPMRKQDGKVFLTEIRKFNLINPFKSLHKDTISLDDVKDKEYINIEGIAFEGPLVKREVVEHVGLPNKELFLLYDDSDYSYRTVLAGYEIRLVTKAIMNKEFFFANDSRVVQVQKGKWKLYYHIRNTVYFNRQYGKNIWVRNLRSLGVMLQYQGYAIINLFFNKKYCVSDMNTFLHAYQDGMKKRLGKRN